MAPDRQQAIGLMSTLDTKGREIAFVQQCLEECGRQAIVIDVGLREPEGVVPDISRHEVAAAAGAEIAKLLPRPREEIMATMAQGARAVVQRLFSEERLEGLLGLGGNQGTSVVCTAFRDLPFGFPRVVISTVASGNLRPYIGASDIAVLFSVSDLLGGPNPIVAPVLRNAAAAVLGMVSMRFRQDIASAGPVVAITSLGNTHPAVVRAMQNLRGSGLEVAAFHACGACGSAMERLIAAGRIAAVLELTPHELTEEVLGTGWYQPVEPGRLLAAGKQGIPQVVVPGSMEYLCFGPPDSIPARLRRRPTYFHNPLNANVQASPREMALVGRVLAERLNQANGPVAVVVPEKGWSIYGAPGGPLHHAAAMSAFLTHLTQALRKDIPVYRLPRHINDPEFADYCCNVLREFLARTNTPTAAGDGTRSRWCRTGPNTSRPGGGEG